ncbi:MAG: flavodoxin domain-containing protein, partial [Stenotrophomonas nitritireducens]|nr:flavodoxin domain-containing protein [Stenotrophomonas nitritireducens]
MTAAAATVPPSPLPDDRRVLLTRLVDGLDGNSLWWLSGFAAGLAQGHPPPSLAVIAGGQPAAQAAGRLTIVYGSQTGNARRAAEQLAGDAEAAGLAVRLLRADAYPTR